MTLQSSLVSCLSQLVTGFSNFVHFLSDKTHTYEGRVKVIPHWGADFTWDVQGFHFLFSIQLWNRSGDRFNQPLFNFYFHFPKKISFHFREGCGCFTRVVVFFCGSLKKFQSPPEDIAFSPNMEVEILSRKRREWGHCFCRSRFNHNHDDAASGFAAEQQVRLGRFRSGLRSSSPLGSTSRTRTPQGGSCWTCCSRRWDATPLLPSTVITLSETTASLSSSCRVSCSVFRVVLAVKTFILKLTGTEQFVPEMGHTVHTASQSHVQWKHFCAEICWLKLSFSADDSAAVKKAVAKKSHNLYYDARLLTGNYDNQQKPKKVYCYISPKVQVQHDPGDSVVALCFHHRPLLKNVGGKTSTTMSFSEPWLTPMSLFSLPQQLTVKEFYLKVIPKRLFTFRVCPSTKVGRHALLSHTLSLCTRHVFCLPVVSSS